MARSITVIPAAAYDNGERAADRIEEERSSVLPRQQIKKNSYRVTESGALLH